MWSKQTFGIIGMIAGGIWLVANFRHVESQGFVAIGMPLILLAAGAFYFFRNRDE